MQNNNDFKISVLITFYNQERYVDQAIKSVIEQKTTFRFKIIIGDDGSDDGTLNKIANWKSNYPDIIEYIVQKREKKKYPVGLRSSRNRLSILKMVETPYFIFLDGDDYWTDIHKLQYQYDVLEDKDNQDCIGCGHIIRVYHENNPRNISYIPNNLGKERKYGLKEYWGAKYFSTDTIVFRSRYINSLPYNTIQDFFNDNLITYCFMQWGKLYYIPKAMCDYRQNDKGIYVGANDNINIIRELISLNLEIKINRRMIWRSINRHLSQIVYASKNRNSLRNIGEIYNDQAQKYDLKIVKRYFECGQLFSDNKLLDEICLMVCFVLNAIKNIKSKIFIRITSKSTSYGY